MSNETPESLPTHAVIYTDGGFSPSARVAGWGLHGYIYQDTPSKTGTGNPKANPTPKGYKGNAEGPPKITLLKYIDGFGAIAHGATNNVAELTSMLRALEIGLKHASLHIVADSQYALNGLTQWVENWERNNWRKGQGEEVANAELWRKILATKRLLAEKGITLSTEWVKGHSGNLGNEKADVHANRGQIAAKNGHDLEMLQEYDAKGYWNNKSERSRFFSHPNWYFGTQTDEYDRSGDGRYIYYLGDPREDVELLGKKISDATFSILYLKQPDPVLEKVRHAALDMAKGGYQGLMIGKLSEIFKPEVYNEVEEYGDQLLQRDYQRQRLFSPNELLLVEEVRPTRLAYAAIDSLRNLETTLAHYLAEERPRNIRVTDITDLLYETTTGKKKAEVKLKPQVTSAMRSMPVEVAYAKVGAETGSTKVVLTLSQDLPDRNTLAALACEDVKVSVVTWPESEHAIRFATVIEANGDVGIWSGIYSNLHLLGS